MKRVTAFRIVLTFLLIGMFSSAFNVQRAMAQMAVVSVYPPMNSELIGETFTVNITVAGVTGLNGWEVELAYDPAILNATEITEGSFLKLFGPETFMMKRVNNTAGFLFVMSMYSHPIPPFGAHGEGILAHITFTVKSIGQTTLRVGNRMTDLITAEADSIWHKTQDAYFDNRLLTTHTELLEDYSSLLSNYTRLQEDYKTSTDELGMARNLNYLLVITTVAFVATTAYFALRKPKLKGA